MIDPRGRPPDTSSHVRLGMVDRDALAAACALDLPRGDADVDALARACSAPTSSRWISERRGVRADGDVAFEPSLTNPRDRRRARRRTRRRARGSRRGCRAAVPAEASRASPRRPSSSSTSKACASHHASLSRLIAGGVAAWRRARRRPLDARARSRRTLPRRSVGGGGTPEAAKGLPARGVRHLRQGGSRGGLQRIVARERGDRLKIIPSQAFSSPSSTTRRIGFASPPGRRGRVGVGARRRLDA